MNASVAAGDVHLLNNTIVDNTAGSNHGGIFRQSNGQVFNNIVYANTPNNIGGSSGSAGNNLTTDPMFVGSGDLVEAHHIQSASPARDAGTDAVANLPTSDYEGHPRPADSTWDIGFDEFILGPYINKAVEPVGTLAPGDGATFILNFYNVGPLDVTNVVITDIVPAGFTGLSYTSNGAALTPIPGQTYAWQVEDLSVNEGGVITISGIIGLDMFGQTLTNTAQIEAEAIDDSTPYHYEHSAVVNVCQTIQCMIDAADPGDTVMVPAGTYTESLTLSKPVSVTGVSSTTVVVQAPDNQRVMTIDDASVTNDVLISGMTFTGGNVYGSGTGLNRSGGGILITNGAQPRLQNMIIAGNRAGYRGGGIYMAADDVTLTISDSIFENNSADYYSTSSHGGGIYLSGQRSELAVSGVIFSGNSARSKGGAIYVNGVNAKAGIAGNSLITGNQVTYNHDETRGGGIYLEGTGAELSISDSTLAGNYSERRGGAIGGNGENVSLGISNSSIVGSQAQNQYGGGIYLTGTGAGLTITGSALSENSANSYGGAIFASATDVRVVITDSIIDNNTGLVSTSGQGGGIYLSGTGSELLVKNSTFSNNRVQYRGGGIYANGTDAKVTIAGNSLIIGNETTRNYYQVRGGGVYLYGSQAELIVVDSTLSGNTSTYYGGAIAIEGYNSSNRAILTITNSELTDNEVTYYHAGGLYAYRTATTIADATISGNTTTGTGADGGGLYLNQGTALITGTTISNNTANDKGGGLLLNTTAQIANTTISGNATTTGSDADGGGVYNYNGNTTFTNVTIAYNHAKDNGGGIYRYNGRPVIKNSIVAANTSDDTDNNCSNFGSYVTGNNNLSDNNCPADDGFTNDANAKLLGPLADNGGDTLTHALLGGNPAINQGDNATCAAFPVNGVDQRGAGRTVGDCDIGAIEAAISLSVDKSAANTGGNPLRPGERITYTITLENDGAMDVTNVVISDTFPAHTTYVPGSLTVDPPAAGGAPGTQPTLVENLTVPAESIVTVSYAVTVAKPLTDGVVIANAASVTGAEAPNPITGDVANTVTATPQVAVTKTGPAAANVNDTVVYTFTVTNQGDTLLHNIIVVDDQAGQATTFTGDTNGNDQLDLTESWVYALPYPIAPTTPDLLVNTVTVTATDSAGTKVTATGTHTTNIQFSPALTLTKTGPASANVGDTVVYTFTVSHEAGSDGSPVSDVVLADPQVSAITLTGGDDGDDRLEWGETWVFTTGYTIQPDDPNPLVNTGTVTGQDPEGDEVSATGSHSIALEYAPALNISKSGPASASVGEEVTYLFFVANDTLNGDGSPISSVSVTDDVAGPASLIMGDGISLEGGETWLYSVSYIIQGTEPNPLVNTGTVTGTDRDGDEITATDTHTTSLGSPTPVLRIVKDGPASAIVGDTVVYTFTVSHDPAGDNSPVNTVTVTDDVAGPATPVSSGDGDDLLEAGETWVYTAGHTILPTDPNPLVNTASVAGKNSDGDDISATDTHTTTLSGFAPVSAHRGRLAHRGQGWGDHHLHLHPQPRPSRRQFTHQRRGCHRHPDRRPNRSLRRR